MGLLELAQNRVKKSSEGWNTSPIGKSWENWDLEKRRLEGDFTLVLQDLKGAYKKDGNRHFSITFAIGHGAMVLN